MKLVFAARLFFAFFLLVPCAYAQQGRSVVEGYDNVLKGARTIQALGTDMFGDQTNMFDGSTAFEVIDVEAKPNSGLRMAVGRKLAVNGLHMDSYGSGIDPSKNIFGNYWDLNVPYMRGVFAAETGWVSSIPNHRCSDSYIAPPVAYGIGPFYGISYDAKDYWSGNRINIPGFGEEDLLQLPLDHARPNNDETYYGSTKSNWRVSCVNTIPGEGYLVTLPNGVKYRFDWMAKRNAAGIEDTVCNRGGISGCRSGLTVPRVEVTLYATLVTDRFGNWVSYAYDPQNPHRLLSITSNDGVAISLSYDSAGKVGSVAHAGRAWTYSYSGNHSELTEVVQPDASRWQYAYSNLVNVTRTTYSLWESCNIDSNVRTRKSSVAPVAEDIASFTATHPSGAYGLFKFRKIIHGTNHTPGYCWRMNEYFGQLQYARLDGVPMAYQVASIYEKTIGGSGVAPRTWSYYYEPSWSWSYQGYCNAPRVCGTTSRTKVAVPDGTTASYTFGNDYETNAGQLLEVKLEAAGKVVKTINNTYLANATGQVFKNLAGNNRHGRTNSFAYLNRPLVTQSIQLNDVIYNRTSTAFDYFVQPIAINRQNTLGYSRSDATEYHEDLTFWVLSQPKRGYNIETGVIEYETGYNSQALPEWTKKYGKLQETYVYHADGTLASIADGRGNAITLSSWKRGIPQQIRHPATPESPMGATESVVVNDNGWVTSVTDENEYVTGYGYDAMGRLASIAYPTGDSVAWLPKIFEFRAITATDWLPPGISVGQWRQYEGQGNYAKFTYYDAMWRPVLVQEYDTSNVTPTVRYNRTAYDSSGRVSFQSYPAPDANLTTIGTRTFYDALDRVTKVEQDSEQNILSTVTEYLAGLQVRVTNPRGYQTTTGFMAWDQPGYDLPLWSSQPEGKVVEILRHPQFGWPLQLKQRSADNSLQQVRSYVYDGNAQLCKTIEPETGATVTGYDAANNPVWSASGLTGGTYASTTDCSYVAANASGRVVNRAYDTRNRIAALNFPNGRGNQIWTYEKDGQPASVTAYNDTNNTTPVVTAYTYNKRRMLKGESLSQPGWYAWGIGYEYDPAGNLRWQSYPTGLSLDYAPNAMGQSTGVRDQNNKFYASNASYYPNGALKQFTYGNSIVHTMTQNARQLPSQVTSSSGVNDFTYNYDVNANITNIWDLARGDNYSRWMTYDGLDRLASAGSASFGGDAWHRYTYDALDNLKSWKLAGVKDYADYVYENGTNRLTSIRNTAGATVVEIGYDAQGNLQNKNEQTYEFDYGNRLRGVIGKEYYRYDGLGRRVLNWRYPTASTPNGTLSLSQYSQSGQLIYQEDDERNLRVEHVYFAGSLITEREINWSTGAVAVKYQHTDALGSPVAVTNEAGAVIERNDYEPYGAVIGQPNKNGIGYTGHMMDGATALTYMQQRYYDQSLGRFLSVDPVTANSANGTNFNRYKYAENNPYIFVDPDGRQSLETLGPSSTVTTGSPFLDSLLKPSDVQAMGQGQMMREQLASELSRPMSWRERLTYIGFAMSLGTRGLGVRGGKSANIARRADAARDALGAAKGRKHATYTGGYKDGRAVAGCSSNPTGCGEDDVARQLGNDAQITKSFGWRRSSETDELEWTEIPVCTRCQGKYDRSQFPHDVKHDAGGSWDKK
jgi:RHS repeat-associated protein